MPRSPVASRSVCSGYQAAQDDDKTDSEAGADNGVVVDQAREQEADSQDDPDTHVVS
jgi:hypothetical protein